MNMFIPFTTYIIHRYSLQFWPQLGKWYKNIWFSIILWRTSEEFRYYEIPHTLRTCYSPNFRPWRGEGIGRLGRKSTCWCWSTYDKWVHILWIYLLMYDSPEPSISMPKVHTQIFAILLIILTSLHEFFKGPAICKDNFRRCKILKRRGGCRRYRFWMKKNCMASCKYCNKGSQRPKS